MSNVRLKAIVLATVILAALPMLLFGQDDVNEALYGEGLRKYILKDYEGALKNFESLYALDPADIKSRKMLINTLTALGDIAYEKNDFAAAEDAYIRASGLSPGNQDIRNRIDLLNAARARQAAEAAAVPSPVPVAPGITAPAGTVAPSTAPAAPVAPATPAAPPEDSAAMELLERLVASQESAREDLNDDVRRLDEQRTRDRDFFLRIILIAVGASLGIALIIVLIVVLAGRGKRGSPAPEPMAGSVEPGGIPRFRLTADDYATDERHSDVVRAQRLTELAGKLNRGEDSWDNVKEYVAELNADMKEKILEVVEKELTSTAAPDSGNVMSVLLPLVTDGNEAVGGRTQSILSGLTGGSGGTTDGPSAVPSPAAEEGECPDEDPSDPMSYDSLLQLANLVDAKTGRTEHGVKVGDLSREIAARIGDPSVEPLIARKVGLVLDIGFLEISDEVMKKDGPLNDEELALMRSHTERGPELLDHAHPSEEFIIGMTMHHERLDGSGYPKGLSGDEIPMMARIVGAADMFCAATSSRPFRKPLSIDACLEVMRGLSGTQLDAKAIDALMEMFDVEGNRS